jgi:hypothetical protein
MFLLYDSMWKKDLSSYQKVWWRRSNSIRGRKPDPSKTYTITNELAQENENKECLDGDFN